jgi:hypothetical protein
MVYLLMGVLALMVVFKNPDGRNTDPKGAIKQLMTHPSGYIFVLMLAVGLCCYALWRFFEAHDRRRQFRRNLTGYVWRLGLFSSALVHLALGYYAFNLVFEFHRDKTPWTERKIAKWVLSFHNGDVFLGVVAIGILIFGLAQVVIALREYFLDIVNIPEKRKKYLMPVCKFGLVARGFVFMIVGCFFLSAAYYHDSHEAGGLKQAWIALAKQPIGWVWVSIVAVGLIAYAGYCAVEAIYRRRM